MSNKTFKKIAIVTPYYYPLFGGVQENVYNLKEEYKKLGYYCRVITAHFGKTPSKDEDEVLRFGRGFPIKINGSVGRIIMAIDNKTIRKMIDQYDFDIIHFQEPFVPFLSYAIIKYSKAVHIATFHANFKSNPYYRIGTNILNPLWKKIHGRIAVSPSARNSIIKYFKGDIEIIPNGVDMERFCPNHVKISKYNDGKINILFTGRIEKRKGLKYLLHAYAELKPKYPNTRIIIVGCGPIQKEIQKFVKQHCLEDVHFEGFVPERKLPSYYSTADIYCSPALFGESFGIVLLEAMASEVPVVAFNISGFDDVISNMKEGLLVAPRDVHDLAQKLELLIKNPELRKELGRRGLEKARSYTWNKIARQYINYYKQVWDKYGNP